MAEFNGTYTLTLIKLYEQQGYFDDAVKGVRSLLIKDPKNEPLKLYLNFLEKKRTAALKKKLPTLLNEWITLIRANQNRE